MAKRVLRVTGIDKEGRAVKLIFEIKSPLSPPTRKALRENLKRCSTETEAMEMVCVILGIMPQGCAGSISSVPKGDMRKQTASSSGRSGRIAYRVHKGKRKGEGYLYAL